MSSESRNVAAIILAAGASTRLGRPKQLEPIGGNTMLQQAIDTARAAGCQCVVVVLGAGAEAIARSLANEDIDTVFNPAWEQGMGTSIAAGANYVAATHPQAQSILICTCDQPRVTSEQLRALIDAAVDSPADAAAAVYAGRRGVPACFGKSHIEALSALLPGAGAKKLLESDDGVAEVSIPEAEFDVDTPEDAAAL